MALCLAISVMGSVSLLLAAEPPGIPDEIPGRGTSTAPGTPIWIAAERAVEGGALRPDLFDPRVRRDLEWAMADRAPNRSVTLESSEHGTANGLRADDALCTSWARSPNDWAVADFSYETLIDHAQLALIGVVRSEREGFLFGYGTTLFEVEVEEVLEAPPSGEAIEAVYVSYPSSSIAVGDQMLCSRSVRYPARPQVGRHLLVFAATIPEWDPIIINPSDDELFFEGAKGEVSFPAHLGLGDVTNPPMWHEFVGERGQNLRRSLTDR